MNQELKIVISAVAKGIGDVRKMSQEFTTGGRRVREAGRVFSDTMRGTSQQASLLTGTVKSLLGAWAGFAALSNTLSIVKESEAAFFNLQSSVAAANREFGDVGSVESWEGAIKRLSDEMLIYSDTAIAGAISRTVDMTKRLGLNQAQMEEVIKRSADLGAGKVDLEGAIERVTAALRGEAESAEFLGLTLNENYIKAWYEASDAQQKAWKDLTDLEKAQVRYQVVLEQSAEFQGRAAESAKTFGGALALVKKELTNAVANNKNLTAALGEVATALRNHAGEIGEALAKLVTLGATVAEVAIKYRNLIAVLIGGYVAVSAVSKLVRVVGALHAAFVVLTGTGLAAWFVSLRTALLGVAASGGLAATALKAGVAAAAAWGVVQIGLLIKAAYEWRQAAKMAEESQGRMIAQSDKALNSLERFRDVRLPDNITGSAPDDLERLQWELLRARDYYTVLINKMNATGQTDGLEEAKARLAEIRGDLERLGDSAKVALEKPKAAVTATTEQLEAFEKAAKEAYQAAIKEAQKYADKVREYEEKANLARLDAADRLRELTRKTLSEEEAYNDRQRQYDEKLYAAREALRQKDYEQAERLYSQAQDIAAGLAEEVTRAGASGNQEVIQTLAQSTELAKQKYQEASEGLVQVYEAVRQEAQAEHEARMGEAETLKAKLEEVAAARQAKIDIKLTNLAEVQSTINGLIKDETKHIYVTVHQRTVEEHAAGGMAGAFQRRRGRLGGWGGGDKIKSLLEAGEYIVRKEAVAKYGTWFFDAINGMRMALPGLDGIVRAQLGGLVSAAPLPAYAAGGLARPGETMTLELAAGNVRMPLTVAGNLGVTRQGVREIEKEIRRMRLSHR